MGGLRQFFALTAKVEPFLWQFHLPVAYHGGNKDSIAPNDGRGPAASGYVALPGDILVGAPAVGKIEVIAHAERFRAAELGPVCAGDGSIRGDAAKSAGKQ